MAKTLAANLLHKARETSRSPKMIAVFLTRRFSRMTH